MQRSAIYVFNVIALSSLYPIRLRCRHGFGPCIAPQNNIHLIQIVAPETSFIGKQPLLGSSQKARNLC